MTPEEKFIEDVTNMRIAQKLFFATKSREAMIAAMGLEKEIDEYLQERSK